MDKDTQGIIHNSEKKLLSFLHEICIEKGLTYYLAYGTLLGAVRHKGFIPWDDDADIWMPRKDYNLLLKYFKDNKGGMIGIPEAELSGNVNDGHPMELQMKICDKSLKVEQRRSFSTVITHPWVDIFALDSFPEDRKTLYVGKIMYTRTKWILTRQRKIEAAKKYTSLIKRAAISFVDFFHIWENTDEQSALMDFENALLEYRNIQSDEMKYYSYASVYYKKPKKCIFDQRWFGHPNLIEFEGKQLCAPSDSDRILKQIYGDYMQLPPVEKRENTHLVKIVDE